MPVVTTRLLIVAPVADRDLVNATLAALDPNATGPVLVVALRKAGDTTNTPAAYWASWAMDDETRQFLITAVRDARWTPAPSPSEVKVYVPGDVVPSFGTQRVWLFDGPTYAPEDALRTLGLDLIPDEH